MPLRNRILCTAVIALLLGSLWSGQARATEPSNVTPAITPPPPSLNEKDLFPYKQKGRGTLAGQAFLSSPSGKAITQAGAPIHLIPITPYTRYWFGHNVRATSCSTTEPPTSSESAAAPRLCPYFARVCESAKIATVPVVNVHMASGGVSVRQTRFRGMR